MSRHNIPGKNPVHDAVVGWDPPLHTLDPTKDEEDDGYTVLWVGTTMGEIKTITSLQYRIREHAEISYEVLVELSDDRLTNRA